MALFLDDGPKFHPAGQKACMSFSPVLFCYSHLLFFYTFVLELFFLFCIAANPAHIHFFSSLWLLFLYFLTAPSSCNQTLDLIIIPHTTSHFLVHFLVLCSLFTLFLLQLFFKCLYKPKALMRLQLFTRNAHYAKPPSNHLPGCVMCIEAALQGVYT